MMTKLRRITLALALASTLSSCGAANYRLDEPLAQRVVAPREVLRLRWRRSLVTREFMDYRPQEWASAAIDRGVIYVGSSRARFEAIDARDGRVIWGVRTEAGVASTPLLAAETVYFGAGDGKVYAVERATGRVRWTYATQGTIDRAPVLADDRILLFTSSEGRIYALDAKTGAWRWQYDREAPEGFTIQGYAGVALRGGIAYTGFSDGMLVALKVYTGDVVWTRSLAGGKTQFVDVDTTPVFDGDSLLAASYAGGVHALAPDNGSVRWQYPVEGASDLLIHGSSIYLTAPRVGLMALDRTGRLRWRQAVALGVPSRPVPFGDYLLVTGTETGLYVVRRDEGELLQYFDPGHGMSAAPAAGSGLVVALSNQGQLYAFSLAPSPRRSGGRPPIRPRL